MLINVPAPSSATVSNLLGVAGLVGVTTSIGALAGNWWWSALLGSLFFVAIAYVTHLHAAQAAQAAQPVAAAADDGWDGTLTAAPEVGVPPAAARVPA